MDENLFPIPKTGSVQIVPTGEGTFDVECRDICLADNHELMGFFCGMKGRFGSFRFEYSIVSHKMCRFDRDSVDFINDSRRPDTFSVIFPIRVLPRPPFKRN